MNGSSPTASKYSSFLEANPCWCHFDAHRAGWCEMESECLSYLHSLIAEDVGQSPYYLLASSFENYSLKLSLPILLTELFGFRDQHFESFIHLDSTLSDE